MDPRAFVPILACRMVLRGSYSGATPVPWFSTEHTMLELVAAWCHEEDNCAQCRWLSLSEHRIHGCQQNTPMSLLSIASHNVLYTMCHFPFSLVLVVAA